MVPYEHRRSRLAQVIIRIVNLECDPREEPHGVLEASCGGPLRDAVVSQSEGFEQTEEEGSRHAVGGTQDEREVGGEEAREEAEYGVEEGHGEQEGGKGGVVDEAGSEVGDDRGHVACSN